MLQTVTIPISDTKRIIEQRFGFKYPKERRRESLSRLSELEISRRKRDRCRETANILTIDDGFKRFIEWINSIQAKLGISDTAFARRLGLAHQRILYYWRKGEKLPSDIVLNRLLQMEKTLSVKIRTGIN